MKTIYIMKEGRSLPLAKEADDVMEREDFREYISVHGYHFTCKLADYASEMIDNVDGSNHRWTTEQVSNAIKESSKLHSKGDIAYFANMMYSDFYPHILKTEADVLEAVKDMIKDKDGYEGMVFMRWISDLIGRGETVDWLKYM